MNAKALIDLRGGLVGVGIATICVAAGVLLWQNRPAAYRAQSAAAERAFAADAAELFERAESLELTHAAADRQVPAAINSLPLRRSDDATPSHTPAAPHFASLIETVSTLFQARCAADPAPYEAHLRSQGYTLHPIGGQSNDAVYRALDDGAIAITHSVYGAGTPPENLSPEAYFRFRFLEELRWNNAEFRPAAITAGPQGGAVYFDRWHDLDLRWSRPVEGAPELESHWAGYSAVSFTRHWDPPISLDEVFARDGHVDVAALIYACEGATGRWWAEHVYAYFDPEARVWHIDKVVRATAGGRVPAGAF